MIEQVKDLANRLRGIIAADPISKFPDDTRDTFATEFVETAFKLVDEDASKSAQCAEACVKQLLATNFDRCTVWTRWTGLRHITDTMTAIDEQARLGKKDYALPAIIAIPILFCF